MIVIDTSAVVAILLKESDAETYIAKIEADYQPLMASPTFVELNAVMKFRHGKTIRTVIDQFIKSSQITIEPFTHEQALIAREAYYKFGSLNFGDTYSYALAKAKEVPLLFKGNDFSKTDIQSC